MKNIKLALKKLMKDIYKKVELVTNISIVFVAVLLGVVLFKHYILGDSVNSGSRAIGTDQITTGAKISVPEIDWAESNRTLLLVLSQGCHFCSESAPFYQRLVRETAGRADIRLVALFPKEIGEGKRYLNDLNVAINEVKQASLDSIKVTGTPTIILVNNAGAVTGVWVGQLPPEKESEVLNRLESDRASN